ncbi:LPD5 domain-containing protein [Geitlerinema calcuttense]|uniref:LPD5 domain-containing protein n=1 Tax=Geitlerinema calcuttense NRMC-F 0142 TaxID=2922238 RepID=A0ABT7LV43_9CYAN|nr:LPD5 domain-containing protein [Geitlerinema calcuttense]MDL5055903.1 LPD5 domain-containing protein [Geitlerinema calcuttense NRMC-F 0142]
MTTNNDDILKWADSLGTESDDDALLGWADSLQSATTTNGVDSLLDRMRGSVVTQESGGNPKARNARTSATGLFQVLPSNIPNWTQTYLGKRLTPEQFANDVNAQEKVFRGEMGKYLKKAKAKGVDDDTAIRMASAAWYGGEGAMGRYDDPRRFRPDEPSFREYTRSILNRIKKTDGPSRMSADSADAIMRDVSSLLGTGSKPMASDILPTINPVKPSPTIQGQPMPPAQMPQAPPVEPESTETIAAQAMSMLEPSSPRSALLLNTPEQEQSLDPSQFAGFMRLKTPNGILIVNPAKARKLGITNIPQFVAKNGFAKLIGKAADVGNNTDQGLVVVTTAPDGTELASSVVRGPDDAKRQAEIDRRSFPNVQVTQRVVSAQDVVAARKQQRAAKYAQAMQQGIGPQMETPMPVEDEIVQTEQEQVTVDDPTVQTLGGLGGDDEFKLPTMRPIPEDPPRQYTKRDTSKLKPGERFYEFERTGKAGDLDYLGQSEGKHYFTNADGDEFAMGSDGKIQSVTTFPAQLKFGDKTFRRAGKGVYESEGELYNVSPTDDGYQVTGKVSDSIRELETLGKAIGGDQQAQSKIDIDRKFENFLRERKLERNQDSVNAFNEMLAAESDKAFYAQKGIEGLIKFAKDKGLNEKDPETIKAYNEFLKKQPNQRTQTRTQIQPPSAMRTGQPQTDVSVDVVDEEGVVDSTNRGAGFKKVITFRDKPDNISNTEWARNALIPDLVRETGLDAIDIETYLKQGIKTRQGTRLEDTPKDSHWTFELTADDIQGIENIATRKRDFLRHVVASGEDIPAEVRKLLSKKYGLDPQEIEEALQGGGGYGDAFQEGQKTRAGYEKLLGELSQSEDEFTRVNARALADIITRKITPEEGQRKLDASEKLLNELRDIERSQAAIAQRNIDRVNRGESRQGVSPYVARTPEQVEGDVLKRFAEIEKQYGDAENYYKEQERIAKEYKYRPLSKPIEFAKGVVSAVPQAVSSLLNYSYQIQNLMPNIMRNPAKWALGKEDEIDADAEQILKAAEGINDLIDYALNPNKDLSGYYEAGNVVGQVLLMAGTGAVTGSLKGVGLLGAAMEASEQYDDARKAGVTDPATLREATIVGTVSGLLDVLPIAWALKPLRNAEKTGVIGGLFNRTYQSLVKEVGEKQAAEITKNLWQRFVDRTVKVATGSVIESGQELTQKKIKDLHASLRWDPARKVWELSSDDIWTMQLGALGGAVGGGLRTAIESRMQPAVESAQPQGDAMLRRFVQQLDEAEAPEQATAPTVAKPTVATEKATPRTTPVSGTLEAGQAVTMQNGNPATVIEDTGAMVQVETTNAKGKPQTKWVNKDTLQISNETETEIQEQPAPVGETALEADQDTQDQIPATVSETTADTKALEEETAQADGKTTVQPKAATPERSQKPLTMVPAPEGKARRRDSFEFDAPKTKTQRAIDLEAKSKPSPTPLSNTQIEFSKEQAKPFDDFRRSVIDTADVADRSVLPEYAKDGIFEIEPHVTVKYGLKSNTAADIAPTLKGEKPIKLTLGKTSVFKGSEKKIPGTDKPVPYDVVTVEVSSPDLERLNKKLTDGTDNTTTFPYSPHVTLAYVKPGMGEKYAGRNDFEGQEFTFDGVTFSPADKSGKSVISLGEKGDATLRGEAHPATEKSSEQKDVSAKEKSAKTSEQKGETAKAETKKKAEPRSFVEKSKELWGENWYVSNRPIERYEEAGATRVTKGQYAKAEKEWNESPEGKAYEEWRQKKIQPNLSFDDDVPMQSTGAPDAKTEEPKPANIDQFQDYGDKIGGAKKDIYQRVNGVTDEDLTTQPLSKAFPRPDFAQLINNGSLSLESAKVLSFYYDNIPAKPRKAYRIPNWVKQVNAVLDIFKDVLASSSPTIAETFLKRANMPLTDQYETYSAWLDVTGFPATSASMRGYQIKKFRPWKEGESPDPAYTIVKGPYIKATFQTAHAAAEHLQKMLSEPSKTTFSIYEDRKTKDIFIGKKGSKGTVRLVEGFATVKEARAFQKDNQVSLEEMWEALKYKQGVERKDSGEEVREGKDWLKGRDIASTEEFARAFGFKSVEFGNWVKQGNTKNERQQSINDAYNSLMDLADVLGLHPKAISLNGTLSLALGARGSGYASAHYEPGKIVINLTKTRGKGSLGHEWWHALDNYFSRMRGDKSGYITESPRVQMIRDSGMFVEDPRIRKELLAAYKEVVDAIRASDLPKRSAKMDRTRAQGYWSTMVEMTARAFENYLITSLGQEGRRNDHLANFRDMGDWAAHSMDVDAFPYPLETEQEAINASFKNLFQTIEQKETEDGNVMMQSRRKGSDIIDSLYNPERGIDYEQIKDVAGRIESGELEIGRLDPAGERGRIAGGRRNVEASLVLAANERAGQKTSTADRMGSHSNTIRQQEKLLEAYAKREGIWFDEGHFPERLFLGRGGEASVYQKDDKRVAKTVNYRHIDKSLTPQEFIDNRIALFNTIFPESHYELMGFMRTRDGNFRFIVTQPFIQGNNVRTQADVDAAMNAKGFDRSGRESYTSELYQVHDLHVNNVLKDDAGTVFIIDAVPKPNYEVSPSEIEDSAPPMQSRRQTSDEDFFRSLPDIGDAEVSLIDADATLNASGESDASVEAMNRQRSEQRQGLTRVKVDVRKPNVEIPLIGQNVDIQPQPNEVIFFRGGNRDGEVIARGSNPRTGRFVPETMDVPMQSVRGERQSEPFYSQVERTIEQKMPNKASAEQIKGILKDAKKEELEWLDLDSFLAENPNPTKQEVLDYVRAHNAQVVEVVKGGQTTDARARELAQEQANNEAEWEEYIDPDNTMPFHESSLEERTQAAWDMFSEEYLRQAKEELGQDSSNTKFSEYTLPGGENYRELLLILPDEAAGGYKSSHWSEPNVLAHVRFDTRDGGKTLHIAEIQSDFGQQLRKERGKIEKALKEDFEAIVMKMAEFGEIDIVC